MRVGIDARTLERTDELRGIGVLVRQIVDRLLAEGVDTILFYSRDPDHPIRHPRATTVVNRLKPAALRVRMPDRASESSRVLSRLRPALGLAWEQLVLPIALRRHPVDVFHAPANRGVPLAGGARFVGSINDVIPLVTPFFFDGQPDPPLTTWLYRVIHWVALSIVAWRSARIITLSQHSRQDIERLFPRARGKVVVIYPGADPRYRRVTDRQVLMQTKERYGLPDRFILYVGGLGQRKNLAGLLQAYALLALRRPETPPLVVVGKRNALYEPLVEETKTLSLAGRVIFPGFIPTDHLPALLSIAELLVYPSFYEGFGLPVVEAMSCGCPVVCSDTSSLPEVGGDGVLYCNPSDPQDIADHMEQVLVNPQLRETLIGKGIAQARRFSVEQMLDATLQVYREVFREGGSA